jgi:hypothetical protein
VKPCCPSADIPARIGVHSIFDCAFDGFARNTAVTFSMPEANSRAGVGMMTLGENIAVRPETTSVFALAAE